MKKRRPPIKSSKLLDRDEWGDLDLDSWNDDTFDNWEDDEAFTTDWD